MFKTRLTDRHLKELKLKLKQTQVLKRRDERNNWIGVLSILAVVTFTGVAHAQTEAGLYRGEVLRTFQDTDSLVAKLDAMGEYVSDLESILAETDMTAHQARRVALSLETRVEGLQRATASLSFFKVRTAKQLLALNVTEIGDCQSQLDYGLAFRMAKNALGKILVDFDDQQDSLGSAILMISEQRTALSELHATNDLQTVIGSADLAYLDAQRLLVAVAIRISQQRRVVEIAYAQLGKTLSTFRSGRTRCDGEYVKPYDNSFKVRGSLGNADWHHRRCCE